MSASKRVSVPDDQQSSKYARRDTRQRGRTHRPSLSAWFDRGMEVQEPEDIDKEKEADASNVSPREDDIDGHLVLPSDATAYVEGSSEGPPFISDHEEAVSEGELQEGRDHAEDILQRMTLLLIRRERLIVSLGLMTWEMIAQLAEKRAFVTVLKRGNVVR